MVAFSDWLDGTALRVFAFSATLFIAMNVAAVALVFARRDRALVNRWTARWLAANLLLIGAGAGVPLAAKLVHMTADALSATRVLRSAPQADAEAEARELAPPLAR